MPPKRNRPPPRRPPPRRRRAPPPPPADAAATEQARATVGELARDLDLARAILGETAAGGAPPSPDAHGLVATPGRERCRHYVGRARPTGRSLVQVWALPERVPLCFDARELLDYLDGAAVDADGPPTPVRNPALVLGNVPPALARTLVPDVSADAVRALRLQARLILDTETRPPLDPAEHNLLWSVVLPAMGAYLARHPTLALVARLYRDHVPARVQGWLRGAGHALRFVYEHPLLSTLAYLSARTLRAYVCMVMFGFDAEEWDTLRRVVLHALNPANHSAVLTGAVNVVFAAATCMRGDVLRCLGEAAGLLAGLLGKAARTVFNMVWDVLAFLRCPITLFGWYPPERTSLWEYLPEGVVWTPGGYLGSLAMRATGGRWMPFQRAVRPHLRAEFLQAIGHPLWAEFSRLYGATPAELAAAVGLWILRHVDPEAFLEWLRVSGDVFPWLRPVHALLLGAYAAVPAGTRGSVHLLYEVVRGVHGLDALRRLVGVWADLLHCLGVLVRRTVGVALGREPPDALAPGAVWRRDCCPHDLLARLGDITGARDHAERLWKRARRVEGPRTAPVPPPWFPPPPPPGRPPALAWHPEAAAAGGAEGRW